MNPVHLNRQDLAAALLLGSGMPEVGHKHNFHINEVSLGLEGSATGFKSLVTTKLARKSPVTPHVYNRGMAFINPLIVGNDPFALYDVYSKTIYVIGSEDVAEVLFLTFLGASIPQVSTRSSATLPHWNVNQRWAERKRAAPEVYNLVDTVMSLCAKTERFKRETGYGHKDLIAFDARDFLYSKAGVHMRAAMISSKRPWPSADNASSTYGLTGVASLPALVILSARAGGQVLRGTQFSSLTISLAGWQPAPREGAYRLVVAHSGSVALAYLALRSDGQVTDMFGMPVKLYIMSTVTAGENTLSMVAINKKPWFGGVTIPRATVVCGYPIVMFT